MIHARSLVLGAGIASLVTIVTFLGLGGIPDKEDAVMWPTLLESEPAGTAMDTLLTNRSPILGNPDAPVTLVEFGDYQCHFCNVFFHSTRDDILRNYIETGKVGMIFKDYNIIGPDSTSASHGAHCADDQGLFWEYHDILYSNWTGENNGWASLENLAGFAREINLDMEQWHECVTNGSHSQKIIASNEDAISLGLTGTPAFFVIGYDGEITLISGAQPFKVFENIFEKELEK